MSKITNRESLKEIPTNYLFDVLKKVQIGESILEPELINDIIDELNDRNLSIEMKNELNNLIEPSMEDSDKTNSVDEVLDNNPNTV